MYSVGKFFSSFTYLRIYIPSGSNFFECLIGQKLDSFFKISSGSPQLIQFQLPALTDQSALY
jgi:hypothetical protein